MIKKFSIITSSALLVSSIALVAYAHEAIARSLVRYSDFEEIEKNIYVAPASSKKEREQLLFLVTQAKERVAATYGNLASSPTIIASLDMDLLKWFASNEYASTSFLPGKSYIVVGPHGHNVDVIAHELVHAGIFEQAGYWVRTVHIPTWFDEGVAMQVDYRTKYDFKENGEEKFATLENLRHSWQFFKGDDTELTMHYAVAKAEVRGWLKKAGEGSIQKLLQRVRTGAGFQETYKDMHDNTS